MCKHIYRGRPHDVPTGFSLWAWRSSPPHAPHPQRSPGTHEARAHTVPLWHLPLTADAREVREGGANTLQAGRRSAAWGPG